MSLSAPRPVREGRIRRILTGSVARNRRVLVACAVLAAMVWPGIAPAADSVDEVLSLVAQERYSEARRLLRPALAREPNDPRLRLMHGILSAREGRAGEAIAIFESLRNDHPDMFEPYNNLAVLYADQDRLDAARGALIAALERKPEAVVYANLGDVYTRLARRAYTRAREIRTRGPRSPDPAGGTGPVPVPSAKPAEPAASPAAQRTAAAAPPRPESAGASETGSGAKQTAPAGPPASLVPSERASAAPLSGGCVRADGFKNRATATGAAEWMQSKGAEIIGIRHQERTVATRYWVHLPPLPSRKAANEKVEELHGKGVRDIAILRKNSQPNVVSLGVFGVERNMRRRVAQLRKLGYRPKTSTTGRTVSAFAVNARAGTARPAFDGAWASRFPRNAIRYVDCPAGS